LDESSSLLKAGWKTVRINNRTIDEALSENSILVPGDDRNGFFRRCFLEEKSEQNATNHTILSADKSTEYGFCQKIAHFKIKNTEGETHK
jgi:hypothetical protein